MPYDQRDIKITDDGDLVLNVLGDLDFVENEECLAQDIRFRYMTNAPDLWHHPELGANFEDVKGMVNTRETGDVVIQKAQQALTYDGRVDPMDLSLRAVPSSLTQIDLYTFITTGGRTISVVFPIPL